MGRDPHHQRCFKLPSMSRPARPGFRNIPEFIYHQSKPVDHHKMTMRISMTHLFYKYLSQSLIASVAVEKDEFCKAMGENGMRQLSQLGYQGFMAQTQCAGEIHMVSGIPKSQIGQQYHTVGYPSFQFSTKIISDHPVCPQR